MSQNSRVGSAISRASVADVGVPSEIVGVPQACWCKRGVTLRMSKSEANPHRRYFRCDLAYENKLTNDKHLFKWVDDALLQEVAKLSQRNHDLKKDISDLFILLQDIAEMEMEAKMETKKMKMLLYVVIGVVAFVSLSKLF